MRRKSLKSNNPQTSTDKERTGHIKLIRPFILHSCKVLPRRAQPRKRLFVLFVFLRPRFRRIHQAGMKLLVNSGSLLVELLVVDHLACPVERGSELHHYPLDVQIAVSLGAFLQ